MQDKKQQLELDIEQTGSKLGKKYIKAVCCHPAYLTYMQSISCEMLAGWSTSWNQDFGEKYQYLSYTDDIIMVAESEEELKMKIKEESEKVGLKLNI